MLTAPGVVGNGALLPADGVDDNGIAGIVAGPGVGGAAVDGPCGSDNGADGAPASDAGVDDNGIEGTVIAPGVGCVVEADGTGGSVNDADDRSLSGEVGSDNGIEGKVTGPDVAGEVRGLCGSGNGADGGNDVEVGGDNEPAVGPAGDNSPVTRPEVPLFGTGGAATVLKGSARLEVVWGFCSDSSARPTTVLKGSNSRSCCIVCVGALSGRRSASIRIVSPWPASKVTSGVPSCVQNL